ncbi:tail assembly chaperone [Paraburkholderia sp. NMBU_R16]|uniref:tail fiber assembly protein n=1 Tax=Paraburkholderia sp. NMBU_R16 TaxID=2698676 RepID=UPI0015667E2B|nr:tail fiber assembly protein [Paraburkholderia sp. NMBU_R16]NRO98127.1 tail assembly chaperone [Paraburkholderia sp. NMBU_R16]
MLIHHYNPTTGEYLSSGQPDGDPRNEGRWLVPASGTFDVPPPRTPTTWPFYRDGAWGLLPDFRGRICYRTDSGEPVEISVAGRTPAELGLTTQPRPSARHSWIDGTWTVPDELIAREKHDAAMAEFSRLMTVARRQTAGKADAYAAGLLDEEQIYGFKAWSAYQMALVSAIEQEAFPDSVEWPPTPEPYKPTAREASGDEADPPSEPEEAASGVSTDSE